MPILTALILNFQNHLGYKNGSLIYSIIKCHLFHFKSSNKNETIRSTRSGKERSSGGRIYLKFFFKNKILCTSLPEKLNESTQSSLTFIIIIEVDEFVSLVELGAVMPRVPSAVHAQLCSTACRGAIMFGQEISESTARGLLSQISSCAAPFQGISIDYFFLIFLNHKKTILELGKKHIKKSFFFSGRTTI